jgi:hypothetical protein
MWWLFAYLIKLAGGSQISKGQEGTTMRAFSATNPLVLLHDKLTASVYTKRWRVSFARNPKPMENKENQTWVLLTTLPLLHKVLQVLLLLL